ncbi:hypothetical protein [Pseudonocardia asaccharolytica]|uniref:DUF4386 domain-containing protein n=1 Tax=Pseudonocardia asaccharolytica DSM 44247 = NBRC 16224 TaxID=1123024 RepID=A0A511DAJ4_9PSEU|nr:hypothetical protein [Pseudonocardia asaccharolytica]GEL20674.1 hypothetical protein PA7_45110 [Pseudonocardia asaccharolytica DSM 44247 = NBRC 16224]
MTTPIPTRSRPQGGPPLAPLAGLALALLVAGLALSAALGGTIPSPFAEPATITGFFVSEPDAVRVGAFFLFGSAVPLALFAATASSRLRTLGVTAPGATIALAGGVLSAAMLTLSALLAWVLARPAVRGEAPVVRALHDLSFLTGGVAHVVFLGLLIAGIAVPGLLLGLLPRPVAIAGLAIAAVAEIATVSLLLDGAGFLLPVARLSGLIWLVVAGFLLPRRRPRRTPEPAPVAEPSA